jgi:glucoamylase
LAERLEDPKAAEYYTAQSERIADILPAFWDDELYWRSTAHIHIDIGTDGDQQEQVREERAWLDCAFPLSVVHAGSDDLFGANESETLATLWRYIMSFEGMYRINDAAHHQPSGALDLFLTSSSRAGPRPWRDGWAVGRYKEDVYNGIGIGKGNPW